MRNSWESYWLIFTIWKYEICARLSTSLMCVFSLWRSPSDTFASKVAATQDQYADASIGNVTGSNAVNVFLGIGVAWSVAAVYWAVQGKRFYVDPGSLAFSVTLFTIFAFICMGVLLFRRRPSIGGELGGSRVPRLLTTLLFLGLWFLYILFSSLEAYCHIKGFWKEKQGTNTTHSYPQINLKGFWGSISHINQHKSAHTHTLTKHIIECKSFNLDETWRRIWDGWCWRESLWKRKQSV